MARPSATPATAASPTRNPLATVSAARNAMLGPGVSSIMNEASAKLSNLLSVIDDPLMRLVPVAGGARVDMQRHRQRDRRQRRLFHHLAHHRQRLLDLVVGHLEHQFVMHL